MSELFCVRNTRYFNGNHDVAVNFTVIQTSTLHPDYLNSTRICSYNTTIVSDTRIFDRVLVKIPDYGNGGKQLTNIKENFWSTYIYTLDFRQRNIVQTYKKNIFTISFLFTSVIYSVNNVKTTCIGIFENIDIYSKSPREIKTRKERRVAYVCAIILYM